MKQNAPYLNLSYTRLYVATSMFYNKSKISLCLNLYVVLPSSF